MAVNKALVRRITKTYVVVIHVLVFVLVLNPELVVKAKAKLLSPPRSELTWYYYEMLAFHRRVDQNIKDCSILFFGDSLTQGLAVNSVHSGSVNYGIGQDTTAGLLKRISEYNSISRANLIVLAIGVNDLRWRSNEDILSNFKELIRAVPSQVPLLISAILPVNETQTHWGGANTRIAQINRELMSLSKESNSIFFLDVGGLLIDSDGELGLVFQIGDGIHLNKLGNAIWINGLIDSIGQILNEKQGRCSYED